MRESTSKHFILLLAFCVTLGCSGQQAQAIDGGKDVGTNFSSQLPDEEKVIKSNEEWSQILDKNEFYILRQHGTERAFSGDLWDHKEYGVYTCAACGLDLFHSETKFKSGTGWPSYYQPIEELHVGTEVDRTYGMVRTEVHCARCGGHLGHIFNDGPPPTGLRYCINSASLDFEPEAEDDAP